MKTGESILIHNPRFQLPVMRGTIERRMLVNFRCEPNVLSQILPDPFRPKLVRGLGMAGICLIHLGNLRPTFVPGNFGLNSENAAHRIAVEWDENGETQEGVFIPRRDTNSRLNQFAGGKLFPGIHHAAKFQVWESGDCFKLEMNGDDGKTFVRVRARVADALATNSVFKSLDEASSFFQNGALGWSARRSRDEFDGLELSCQTWKMEPLNVECVESSFFGNRDIFPPGSTEFDSAFLMRDIAHEWRARGRLTTSKGTSL